jgi:hypothetical protein
MIRASSGGIRKVRNEGLKRLRPTGRTAGPRAAPSGLPGNFAQKRVESQNRLAQPS